MAEDEGMPDVLDPLPSKEITGDPQEGMVLPRDAPRALDEHGVTEAEQRSGTPLGDKLRAEQPDDEEAQTRHVGRLAERGDRQTTASDAGGDAGGMSAEESAMHTE